MRVDHDGSLDAELGQVIEKPMRHPVLHGRICVGFRFAMKADHPQGCFGGRGGGVEERRGVAYGWRYISPTKTA